MPRLKCARMEALAWALASGCGPCEATRIAGYSWGGYAANRCKRKAVVARVAALRPLVEAGAGPDPLSQMLAAYAVKAAGRKSVEGLSVAARISRQAFAEQAKARKAHRPAEAEPRSPARTADAPLIMVDPTLPLEEWLAAVGGELVEE